MAVVLNILAILNLPNRLHNAAAVLSTINITETIFIVVRNVMVCFFSLLNHNTPKMTAARLRKNKNNLKPIPGVSNVPVNERVMYNAPITSQYR